MIISRKAYSKLNLYLEITGKRDDGYHELHSLAVFLDLADELKFEAAEKLELVQDEDAEIDDNIIIKAARKLQQKCNVEAGAKITLRKNIPIGGGLGGGSADAAATLYALNVLWQLDLTPVELYQLALELGADVPACLYSLLERKNAVVFGGIGEKLSTAPNLPELFFVLVNPNRELSTKTVFKNYQYDGTTSGEFKATDFFAELLERRNDLQQTAVSLEPEIAEILKELAKTKDCLLSRMTGSGATCFGIYTSMTAANEASAMLHARHNEWWLTSARPYSLRAA